MSGLFSFPNPVNEYAARVTAALVVLLAIVTIVAGRSDSYHDVGLHYAVLAMLLVPAVFALAQGPAAVTVACLPKFCRRDRDVLVDRLSAQKGRASPT